MEWRVNRYLDVIPEESINLSVELELPPETTWQQIAESCSSGDSGNYWQRIEAKLRDIEAASPLHCPSENVSKSGALIVGEDVSMSSVGGDGLGDTYCVEAECDTDSLDLSPTAGDSSECATESFLSAMSEPRASRTPSTQQSRHHLSASSPVLDLTLGSTPSRGSDADQWERSPSVFYPIQERFPRVIKPDTERSPSMLYPTLNTIIARETHGYNGPEETSDIRYESLIKFVQDNIVETSACDTSSLMSKYDYQSSSIVSPNKQTLLCPTVDWSMQAQQGSPSKTASMMSSFSESTRSPHSSLISSSEMASSGSEMSLPQSSPRVAVVRSPESLLRQVLSPRDISSEEVPLVVGELSHTRATPPPRDTFRKRRSRGTPKDSPMGPLHQSTPSSLGKPPIKRFKSDGSENSPMRDVFNDSNKENVSPGRRAVPLSPEEHKQLALQAHRIVLEAVQLARQSMSPDSSFFTWAYSDTQQEPSELKTQGSEDRVSPSAVPSRRSIDLKKRVSFISKDRVINMTRSQSAEHLPEKRKSDSHILDISNLNDSVQLLRQRRHAYPIPSRRVVTLNKYVQTIISLPTVVQTHHPRKSSSPSRRFAAFLSSIVNRRKHRKSRRSAPELIGSMAATDYSLMSVEDQSLCSGQDALPQIVEHCEKEESTKVAAPPQVFNEAANQTSEETAKPATKSSQGFKWASDIQERIRVHSPFSKSRRTLDVEGSELKSPDSGAVEGSSDSGKKRTRSLSPFSAFRRNKTSIPVSPGQEEVDGEPIKSGAETIPVDKKEKPVKNKKLLLSPRTTSFWKARFGAQRHAATGAVCEDSMASSVSQPELSCLEDPKPNKPASLDSGTYLETLHRMGRLSPAMKVLLDKYHIFGEKNKHQTCSVNPLNKTDTAVEPNDCNNKDSVDASHQQHMAQQIQTSQQIMPGQVVEPVGANSLVKESSAARHIEDDMHLEGSPAKRKVVRVRSQEKGVEPGCSGDHKPLNGAGDTGTTSESKDKKRRSFALAKRIPKLMKHLPVELTEPGNPGRGSSEGKDSSVTVQHVQQDAGAVKIRKRKHLWSLTSSGQEVSESDASGFEGDDGSQMKKRSKDSSSVKRTSSFFGRLRKKMNMVAPMEEPKSPEPVSVSDVVDDSGSSDTTLNAEELQAQQESASAGSLPPVEPHDPVEAGQYFAEAALPDTLLQELHDYIEAAERPWNNNETGPWTITSAKQTDNMYGGSVEAFFAKDEDEGEEVLNTVWKNLYSRNDSHESLDESTDTASTDSQLGSLLNSSMERDLLNSSMERDMLVSEVAMVGDCLENWSMLHDVLCDAEEDDMTDGTAPTDADETDDFANNSEILAMLGLQDSRDERHGDGDSDDSLGVVVGSIGIGLSSASSESQGNPRLYEADPASRFVYDSTQQHAAFYSQGAASNYYPNQEECFPVSDRIIEIAPDDSGSSGTCSLNDELDQLERFHLTSEQSPRVNLSCISDIVGNMSSAQNYYSLTHPEHSLSEGAAEDSSSAQSPSYSTSTSVSLDPSCFTNSFNNTE